MELKKRRINIVLDIGADDKEELSRALEQIALDISMMQDEPHNGYRSVSGGYGSGYTLKIEVDTEMTGDIYREWLEEYRTRDREAV